VTENITKISFGPITFSTMDKIFEFLTKNLQFSKKIFLVKNLQFWPIVTEYDLVQNYFVLSPVTMGQKYL
jgi:hypothetical protein